MLSKSSCISVQLLEPTIYVNSKSDLNNAIRGTINLNLSKTTTIKSISVRFDGKMETKGYAFDMIDTTGKLAKKKAVARQRLVVYPTLEQENAYSPLVLKAGLTQYGFEMQIPSRLPETIDCQDVRVHYYVTAVIEYESQTFLGTRFVKECAKQQVHVTRLPYENIIMNDAQPVDSRTHRSNWLHYQILVNKKAVALGSELPITFRFMPQHDKLTIDRVGIQLLEKRDVCKNNQCHTSYSIQSITPSKENSTHLPRHPLMTDWEGTLKYTVPENKSIVHSTSEYSEFNVSHTLLVSLALSTPGGSRFNSSRVQKMVTYQCNIDLLDSSVGEMDVLKLPTYDFPPPFDQNNPHFIVFPEYDRKFVDPPAYSDIYKASVAA